MATSTVHPQTGGTQIVLNDNLVLMFRWDFYAMALFEQYCEDLPNNQRRGLRMPLRGYLWAGCYRSAVAQGKLWTVEEVDAVIPVDVARLGKIAIQVAKAVSVAMVGAQGESPAVAAAPPAAVAETKPSGGNGKRRKR